MKDQTNKVASQKEYKNHDPIILVHGFNGYASGTGPVTGKGNYWGGNRLKIIQDYRAKGYNVMEASVSAFGSNYDRAVELYYYIKRWTMVRHMRQNMDTSVTEKHTPALIRIGSLVKNSSHWA